MAHIDKASHQLLEHGERHQEQVGWVTTGSGHRVDSLTASLSVGERGPLLFQDTLLHEELAQFDRERIPERVVYGKGAGAFGHFETTHDITRYTKANVFELVGRRTPVVVRFSNLLGERGSPDTIRGPRGLSIKFYSHEGVWDLICSSSPAFPLNDPLLYPSFVHAIKRNPVTNLYDKNMFWDFMSLRPETLHQNLMTFSDRGIPDGYRHMHVYGINTYKLISHENLPFFCKFTFKTNQDVKNLSPEKAAELTASDPDYATRDLYDAIGEHNYPSWTLYIQVMKPEQAEKHQWNPFDPTKVWPHKDYPLIEVGKLILDKNPRNYFADVEEIAFSPANMIAGIEPSPDKILQARLFSYFDSQRHRIGANFKQLPINCHAPTKNYGRDGPMCVTHNHDGEPNYYPNSFGGPIPDKTYGIVKHRLEGNVDRFEIENGDYFVQPREFWNKVLTQDEKQRLIENIAKDLSGATEIIQNSVLENFKKCDQDMSTRLMDALKKLRR